jgi:hypothetical protein
VFFAQTFFEFVRDRFEMRLAGSGANQEKVRKSGDFSQVERDDVFRLFIGDDVGAELG